MNLTLSLVERCSEGDCEADWAPSEREAVNNLAGWYAAWNEASATLRLIKLAAEIRILAAADARVDASIAALRAGRRLSLGG